MARTPGETRLAHLLLVDGAESRQQLGLCALEAVDRLLLVAHREQGRHAVALALPCEEIRGEPRHDFPLLRARILRLVNQDRSIRESVRSTGTRSRRASCRDRRRFVWAMRSPKSSAVRARFAAS